MRPDIREFLEKQITDGFEAKLFLGNRALVTAMIDCAKDKLRVVLDEKSGPDDIVVAARQIQGIVTVFESITRAADAADSAVATLEKHREDKS